MADDHVSVTLMNTSMTYIVNGGWVKAAELSARVNKCDDIKSQFEFDYIYVDSTAGSDYVWQIIDEELTNMDDDIYPNEDFVTDVIGKIISDDLGGVSIGYVDEFHDHDENWFKNFGVDWQDSSILFALSKDGLFELSVDRKSIPVPQSMSVDECFGEIKKRIVTLIPF